MQSSQRFTQLWESLQHLPRQDTLFEKRLSFQFQDLYNGWVRLYGEESAKQYSPRFVELMHTYASKRPEYLAKKDLEREKKHDWLMHQKHACMMLYVDHFAENLKGIESKLDYIQELGINVLHLMPILEVPDSENDGGYAVQDYTKIQKRFGSMSDFRKLTQKLNDVGISVVLDFVMNHCADTHAWAMQAKAGDPYYQEFFYVFPDRQIPDAFDANLVEIFPEMAPGNFTYNPEMQQWVMTLFNTYQWDLNYRNPEVLLAMVENMLFLANQGVDIFRLDAVAYTWKSLGTNCKNLPEAHTLLQLFRSFGKIVCPGVAYIAEAIVEPTEIVKYFGQDHMQGNECDIAYNATLMCLSWEALASQDLGLLYDSLRDVPQKPLHTTWINYIRCHDDIGLGFDDQYLWDKGVNAHEHRRFLIDFYTKGAYQSGSTGEPFMSNPKTGDARISGMLASLLGLEWAENNQNEEERTHAINKINLLHGIMLSYGGLPMIYSGDEIGQTNDYSYVESEDKKVDNRWLHRPNMDWDKAEKRNTPDTTEHTIFQFLKKGIAVRKAEEGFADYNTTHLTPLPDNKTLFAFYRGDYNGDKIVVLANFSRRLNHAPQSHFRGINFPLDCENLLTGDRIHLESGILLNPYQIVWLKAKK